AIKKAMEPRRTERPQSIEAFLACLEASVQNDEIKDEAPKDETTRIMAPPPVLNPVKSDRLTINVPGMQIKFSMVLVGAGSFTMGATSEQGSDACPNETPIHRVTLRQDYYMGKYEVTQELYEAVMSTNPSYFKGPRLPVEQVSWNDVMAFCTRLSQMTGKTFRLPTEAEWEYAARGGHIHSTQTKYAGSNDIRIVAWYTDNSNRTTQTVGMKTPNDLGLHDMSGNVWEWCSDWYGYYDSGAQTDPTGPSTGSKRVNRGGSWSYDAQGCRVSYRYGAAPSFRGRNLGFRLVYVPQ
ncbi:MAG: formylglycine-generating enzyme family protein, partial [Bacteroidales bacterium]|nr:formylglycine-generating enzyme family protein [Bacteroidales bacterium]